MWICTDQQRFDTIRALGNSNIRTPNLDRLVSEGTSFTHAFCQNPICAPSRGSFLTGRYPRTTRLRQNGAKIPDDELLVPKILTEHGYRCGLSGKLHLDSCDGRMETRIDDGYQEFHWSHGPWPKWNENEYINWLDEQGTPWRDVYPLPPEVANTLGPKGTAPDGRMAWGGMPAHLHQSFWCAEMAIKFMDKYLDRPWFFSVNPFDPHHPFDPPQEFLDGYDPDQLPQPRYQDGELEEKPVFQRIDSKGAYGGNGMSFQESTDREHREVIAAYYAMIENIDFNVGRLLDHLEETGQRDKTLVIFMSDHGEMLGDHGIFLKGPYMYEPAIRVPLVFSLPGTVQQDTRSEALIELVDLAPTILDCLGIDILERMQGKSFWNICTGKADTGYHKDLIYCEYYNSMTAHRDPTPYATMIRDSRFKITVFSGMQTGELYDLKEDPYEFSNLWGDPQYRDIREEYVLKCLDASVFTADPLPIRTGRF